MKRSVDPDDDRAAGNDNKMKKIKPEEETEVPGRVAFVLVDENLLYEVLKHSDARTLGKAACVSKQWYTTAQDERLWELICTRQRANVGSGGQQLRSVVLALGGFRRLHSLYLWSLSKLPSISPSPSSPSSSSNICPTTPPVLAAINPVTLELSRPAPQTQPQAIPDSSLTFHPQTYQYRGRHGHGFFLGNHNRNLTQPVAISSPHSRHLSPSRHKFITILTIQNCSCCKPPWPPSCPSSSTPPAPRTQSSTSSRPPPFAPPSTARSTMPVATGPTSSHSASARSSTSTPPSSSSTTLPSSQTYRSAASPSSPRRSTATSTSPPTSPSPSGPTRPSRSPSRTGEQMTSCDDDPTDGGLDVDELIKPIYVVNKNLITESSPDVYSPSENTAGNASEES